MAYKYVVSVQAEIGRELCLVKVRSIYLRSRSGLYRGYKRDILTEKLSERENAMFVCNRCQGIMREVCISTDGGEQFCSCCKKEGEQANPNLQMDNMILSFKCTCPLITRGCSWLGALGSCEEHLDTCGYVLETCKLRCGVVLQRDELKVHEKEKCPQRIVKCKHCSREMKSCELAIHLEMCPKMEVSCNLKCGKRPLRENMAQHLKQECGMVVETCRLGCGLKMTRDELKIHVTETCVQRLIPCQHCKKDFTFRFTTRHLEICPKMKVSCELKCGERLCRENMAQHLKQECGMVAETCRLGCGVEMTRDELKTHVTETCVQRLIPCEHCKKDFKFCDMTYHLDRCPKMEVSCELKCGVVMCREDVTQHVEQDCVEKEIECPFAKYKCVVLMKRNNLRNHLDDKRIEHLELKMDTMQECMLEEFEIFPLPFKHFTFELLNVSWIALRAQMSYKFCLKRAF